MPYTALKTSVHGGYDMMTHSVLAALMVLAADHAKGPLSRLLIESLLYACLGLLKPPQKQCPRKAIRTYDSICLYVQENFRSSITRESVAHHFGLAPNHVSRLFRKEAFVGFNDYLNLMGVNRAKFMLRNYGITFKEIAARFGVHSSCWAKYVTISRAVLTASKCARNSSFISFRASMENTCICRLALPWLRSAIRTIMPTGSPSTEPQSIGRLGRSIPIESLVTASVLQCGAANP